LTVRDTAENVRLIGELLQSIDKLRAEVVMDVNIYEVSRNNLLQLGNQLGAGTFNLGGSPGLAVLTSNGTTDIRRPGVDLRSIVGVTPTAAAAALIIPPSVLTAFQSKTNTRLLASTQVHAFNGEESTARIGQRVPVQTAQAYPFGVQTGTTTSQQTGFPSGGFPVINYEPTGLTLNFTPQVFPNLDVQVKMKIESKDVSGANTLTPTFTERTLTGTARVQNNRTMLLASVSQDVQSNGRQGLPLLGGLPIIGRLFTSPTRDNRQVDIVISVTPRVLRAPDVTPRDEEMRPSGTLQSPTTGSLEAMLQETEREEQIAAARRIPKVVNVQLNDPSVTYEPAANLPAANQSAAANKTTDTAAQPQLTAVSQSKETPTVQIQPAVLTTPAKQNKDTNSQVPTTSNDAAMPQPKTAAPTNGTETAPPRKMDVASAIKSVVAPTTNVSSTTGSSKQEVVLTPAVEQLAPKSEKIDTSAKANDPTVSMIELSLTPSTNDMRLGEKRRLAVEISSEAPVGMAVLTLRFDPKVIRINSLSAGSLFANARTAPNITRSIDEHGVLLVSVMPAAGAAPVSGNGALFNIDIEAIGAGDSVLAFDLNNVHLTASDGRNTLLQIEPIKLTVKQ
jgi:Flp pilus assembly secretin CpaC